MHDLFRPLRNRCTAGWLAAVLAVAASGQTTQPATISYTDPTFGFEVNVPAGWRYDRGRFQGPERALGVLRGERPGAGQALQLLMFRNFDRSGFEAWLAQFQQKLTALHKPHPVRLEGREEVEGRPRVMLAVEPQTSGAATYTHYLVIPFDPNTVCTLVLASTVATPAEAEAHRQLFRQIAGSLKVLYDAGDAAAMTAALERGLKVVEELKTAAARVELPTRETYYNIRIGGKDIGFLRRRIWRDEQLLSDPRVSARQKEGVRVQEESWRFADDRTVRNTEINLFSSFDLESELIEVRTTQVPAPDVQPQRLYIELDQCIRENEILFSSFSTNVDLGLPEPRPPMPILPGYLDLAWVRLLPKLLMRAAPEPYAFAIYDTQTRVFTLHQIQPRGPAEIPGGGEGFRFETREGYVSQPSTVYTDGEGTVVRIVTGDLVISQMAPAEAQALYGRQREAALQRMQGGAGSVGR